MSSKRATFAPRAFGGNAAPVLSPPTAPAVKPAQAQAAPTQVHFKPAGPVTPGRINAAKPIIIPHGTSTTPSPSKPAIVLPTTVKPAAAVVAKPAIVIAKPAPQASAAPVVVASKTPKTVQHVKPAPAPAVAPVGKSSAPSAPVPAPVTKPAIKAEVKAPVASAPTPTPDPAPAVKTEVKVPAKTPVASPAKTPSSPQSLFDRLPKFKTTATSAPAPASTKPASTAPSAPSAPVAAKPASPAPPAAPTTPASLFSRLPKFNGSAKPSAAKNVKMAMAATPVRKDASTVSLVTVVLILGALAIAFNMFGGGSQSGVLRNPASSRCFASGLTGPSLSSNCAGSSAKLSFESVGGNSIIHPYSDPTRCATDHRGTVAFKKCNAGDPKQQWDLSGGHARSVHSKQAGKPKCMSQSQWMSRWATMTDCAANNPAQVFHFQASRVG